MKRCILAVGILLACAPSPAPQAPPPAQRPGLGLQSTAAGRAVSEWLEAYNTGRRDTMEAAITRLYPAAALERRSPADRAAGLANWFRGYGAFTPVRVDSLTPVAAVVTVRQSRTEGWGVLYVDVDSVPPHGITGVGLLPFTEPPEWNSLAVQTEAALVADIRRLAHALARSEVFSGVVLLARDGRPLYREAFGLADRSIPRENTPETQFELASVGKLFTAVATLRLMQEGTLDPESTIGSVLPDLAAPAAQVKIRHLLTMSSGIPDVFRSPAYWAERAGLRSLTDYWRYFATRPLEFEPGTGWSYSNSNFLLLGSAIERRSGTSFTSFVETRVFAPAGMSSTSYRPDAAPLRARGYSRSRPGTGPGAPPDPDNWYAAGAEGDTSAGSPAGGGVSTADDLARFARALMDGRLLAAELVRRAIAGDVPTEYDGRDGWGFETRRWNGVRIVGHGGAFTGVSNQVDWYPDLGYVLVVLGNTDASGAQAIAHRVRGIIASSPALAGRRSP